MAGYLAEYISERLEEACVLLGCPDRDSQAALELGEARDIADEHGSVDESLPYALRVDVAGAEQYEVRVGGPDVEEKSRQAGDDSTAFFCEASYALAHRLVVAERRDPCFLLEGVEVVRQDDARAGLDHLRVGQ